jgi:Tfp pilus assembly protein PilN
LPVLASVPLMASAEERRARRRRLVLTNVMGVFALMLAAAVVALFTLHR